AGGGAGRKQGEHPLHRCPPLTRAIPVPVHRSRPAAPPPIVSKFAAGCNGASVARSECSDIHDRPLPPIETSHEQMKGVVPTTRGGVIRLTECESRCDGHHQMVDFRLTNRRAAEPDGSFARQNRRM